MRETTKIGLQNYSVIIGFIVVVVVCSKTWGFGGFMLSILLSISALFLVGLISNIRDGTFKANMNSKAFPSAEEKQYAQMMAPQWLKISNDCTKIVNTTKKPDIFFERYALLIKNMRQLSEIEHLVNFSGSAPSQNLNEILLKKALTINDFIDRYYNDIRYRLVELKTPNSKQNAIDRFYDTLNFFRDNMETENIVRFEKLYRELKSIVDIK